MLRVSLAALAFLAAVGPAGAATFTAERLTDGRVAIHMHGIIERGDEAKAAAARQVAPTASLFLLDSPGGDFWSSVEIGRLNPLPAEVRTGERCASGCATIWASARERYIEPGANVGFHQASRTVDGHEQTEPRADAEIAAYYGRLGYSAEAIRLMTMAPPSDMHWIGDYDAAHGIAFAPRQTTSGVPINAVPAPASRDVSQQSATDPWPSPKRVAVFDVHPDGTMVEHAHRAAVKPAPDVPKPVHKPAPHVKVAQPESATSTE